MRVSNEVSRARGARSQTAAAAAEAAGIAEIFSLDGGTLAWEKAGLPIERPESTPRATVPAPASPPDPGCGLPEPGLDVAFQVHFSSLLATAQESAPRVLRAADAKRLVSPDGRFSSRALYPFAEKPEAESAPIASSSPPATPSSSPPTSPTPTSTQVPKNAGCTW